MLWILKRTVSMRRFCLVPIIFIKTECEDVNIFTLISLEFLKYQTVLKRFDYIFIMDIRNYSVSSFTDKTVAMIQVPKHHGLMGFKIYNARK